MLLARRPGWRERAWCLSANRWGARWSVRQFFRLVSRLGDGELWFVLIFAPIFLDPIHGLEATANLALVGGSAALLYRRLKHWAKRPRPFTADPRIHAWIAPLDEYSFPSGHTLHAVSFGLVACAWYPFLCWLLLPFAACVALSRVVLGVHYPSDVFAAACIGAALGSATLALAT
jgi:undecaprenyl-diphosphatase